MRSTKPEDQKVMGKNRCCLAESGSTGAHINVSGGGMLKTVPHKDAAIKFLEYLASDQAQALPTATMNGRQWTASR